MLILMYTLWTNEENYDGEYQQKKAARNNGGHEALMDSTLLL